MTQPNVLIIHTDQQDVWSIGAYGGDLIDTPHTDRIAREGVIFRNMFTPSAVCTPSRGCLLTGRYPHCHGAFRNGEPIRRDEVTLAHVLRSAGYQTGYAGKWHLGGGLEGRPGWLTPEAAMGFDDVPAMFNISHQKWVTWQDGHDRPLFGLERHDGSVYMTDWLTDHAIEFLRRRRTGPFLYMLSIPDPHNPFTVRPPYNTMFAPADMPIPESFYEEALPDWAEHDEWGRRKVLARDKAGREDILRGYKAQYCGEVKCIDDNIGRLLAELERLGVLDDTVVVFTSDHGEYMGDHGLMHKNNLYDSVYRIPMMIRWPGRVPAGAAVEKIVSQVDFQQTLLSLLGLPFTGREQGRDASPLIFGRDVPWTEEVYLHPNDVPRAGIITPEWELAYVGRGWGEDAPVFNDHILFDRVNDPRQLVNRFTDPACRPIVRTLTARIVEHHRRLGADPSVLPEPLRA